MTVWEKAKKAGNWVKSGLGTNFFSGVVEEAIKFPWVRSLAKGVLSGVPFVGGVLSSVVDNAHHLADRAKDFLTDKKINGLQETASALKNSQSLLNGQVTELQAGLQEAKDRELELAAVQQRLASELANSTAETKAELELQKKALEEAVAANNTATEQIKTALQATQAQIQEVQSRMADSEKAIEILQNASLSQEEKINSLNELVENERQRMDAFENQMANLANRLEQQEEKLNQHSEQINSLHQKHTELEKKVAENKTNIEQNKRNIQREENQRIIAVNQVKIATIEVDEKVTQLARETKHREKELEQKLTQEQAERERVEKENQKRNHELAEQLEALRQEIRAKQFKKQAAAERAKKLLKFAELKEEKLELEKELENYAAAPTFEQIEQELCRQNWLSRSRGESEASPEIVNQYTLTENSWRKISSEQKEAYGWFTSNQGGSWQIQTEIDREKVSQSLSKKFAFTSQNFGVEAYLKEELEKKLAANGELLLAFASELGLAVELEMEETSQPTEQPNPKEPKKEKPKKQTEEKKETPQPTATNWLTRQIAKVKQLPGATAALSIPWWVYLLLPFLLWLLKKLLGKLFWNWFTSLFRKKKKPAESEEKEPTPNTMPKNKPTKCSCPKTKKGQKKKNAPLCAYCQELEQTKNQPVTNSAKKKLVKKPLLKTWNFWKYLLLTASFSSGSIGGYFWAKEKFFASPEEIPHPEIPTEEEREIPSPESPSEEIIEPESLASNQNTQIYFTQAMTRMRKGIFLDPENVVMKTFEQRKTGLVGYLNCSLLNCSLNALRKECPHGNYFPCPVETCPFSELETCQFYSFCDKHTCQTLKCQQLVVIYEDKSREKLCRDCPFNTSNF